MKTFDVRFLVDLRGAAGKAARGRYSSSLIILSLMLIFASVSMAQTTTSTIEGTVKDANGALIAGAQIKVSGTTLATERIVVTDEEGFYRIISLPAGEYTVTVTRTGFGENVSKIELTLNRVATLNLVMQVGQIGGTAVVTAEAPLVDPSTPATGTTVTPRQIRELPVNGRDYADLLQVVPGVAINRQADANSDNSAPILGERSGNTNFLIDGQPNKDTAFGGPGAQFNQETIAEFQVITAGYKAEFGQASGGIVNVITKSGGNSYHGIFSMFYRNDAFDSSNSLDPEETDAPELSRSDYSLALGGRIIKDKFFFFGSSERITETRELNFKFPTTGNAVVDDLLREQESAFDNPSKIFETRNFLKLDQTLGRHQLTQQMNYTNQVVREFLPLSAAGSLPSRRNDTGARRLMIGVSDSILLGDQGNPWLISLRAAYRGEPSETRPSHPDGGAATSFFPFSSNTTGTFFGDLPSVSFGNVSTVTNDFQKYISASAFVAKTVDDHDLKFGWNFLRTTVDGLSPSLQNTQLFATVDDFANFGAIDAGFFTVTTIGGLTPEANQVHLRNNYNGLFAQDDWRILPNLTINAGIRWDYDSEFKRKTNVSPRLGFVWGINQKTTIRGSYGVFYDNFRLGLASQVPGFGGADRRAFQPFSYPRGFYGVPSMVVGLINGSLFPPTGLCVSTSLTDAQITSTSATCPTNPAHPYIGIDRLNQVVSSGHAFIPANVAINESNIQGLSGLSPDEYLTRAAAAVNKPAGFFFWGPFGTLTHGAIPPQPFPTAIDSTFQTPRTLAFTAGVAREIGRDMIVEVDYHHRIIQNLLGTRQTNLGYRARVTGRTTGFDPPFTGGPVTTFGPFYEGKYDAIVASFTKRFSNNFFLGANYTWASATDNSLGINSLPSDSFVGTVPVTVDPGRAATPTTPACPSKTNATSSYTACNGAFVAQAGTFWNGPDFDKGPSDLALSHIFQVNGMYEFPWQFQVSGIFRAQSGYNFSRTASPTEDPDGNGTFNTIDHGPGAGRNAFTAPTYINLDIRFAKTFRFSERYKLQVLFEYFNLFNRQNPAAVEQNHLSTINEFGKPVQVLPGREGQIGFRFEF